MHNLDEHSRGDDRDAWLQDAERWIAQIQGVRQCKIDLDHAGEISSVHVVAVMGREPRYIVRDVESLLKARLDIDVNYKKIGVVQILEAEAEPAAQEPAKPVTVDPPGPIMDLSAVRPAVLVEQAATPRILCQGVNLRAAEASLTAEVELAAGAVSARGSASGPNHPGNDLVLAGRAAVEAVGQLLADPVTLSLAEVRDISAAGDRVVLAAVELVEGRRAERLFGTCSLQQNLHQAAVFAVLDALNRRLSLMSFKEE